MEYRPLGKTGISVSVIGFGCGSTGGLFVRGDLETQRDAVALALEGGINYFDTAAQYGDGLSEQNLGNVLKDLGATPFIGTKLRVERDELANVRSTARARLEAGLRRLGRDRVDICTLHTRVGEEPDVLGAADVIGPVAEALRELVEAGLTGAIGFTGLGETAELKKVAASSQFDTMQCYFNVLNQSAAIPGSPDGVAQDFGGLLGLAARHGLGVFCIRTLAGGALGSSSERHRLAGSPGRPMARGEEFDEDLRRAGLLAGRLDEFGATGLAELALRFALAQSQLSSVLVGFSDRSHVEEALRVESLDPLSSSAIASMAAG